MYKIHRIKKMLDRYCRYRSKYRPIEKKSDIVGNYGHYVREDVNYIGSCFPGRIYASLFLLNNDSVRKCSCGFYSKEMHHLSATMTVSPLVKLNSSLSANYCIEMVICNSRSNWNLEAMIWYLIQLLNVSTVGNTLLFILAIPKRVSFDNNAYSLSSVTLSDGIEDKDMKMRWNIYTKEMFVKFL